MTATTEIVKNIRDYLRDLLNDNFPNVYISNMYSEKPGREAVRIFTGPSEPFIKTNTLEERQHTIYIRYYLDDVRDNERHESWRDDRVDKLAQVLLENQNTDHWYNLEFDINPYVLDEENEDKNIEIAEFTVRVFTYNIWT